MKSTGGKMFKIGNIEISNRLVLAPMAGVTDRAFRMIAKDYGAGLAFTEMISDQGLVYNQKKTVELADITGELKPVAVQIFGSEVEPMAEAARRVEQSGADIIDINMGCPTPKIVRNGEGAALMLDLPQARQIIRAVVRAVKVPVTIKMRRGWDDGHLNYLDLGRIAEEEGAQAVTLHGRTREQFYSGTADWDSIRKLKEVLTIPVIGNGDIWTAGDALKMIDHTGCDAVMIARGAMGNPFIFREAIELVENGRKTDIPSMDEKIQTAIKHLDLVCQFKGEYVGIREMRKHFSWYIKGIHGAARLREKINQAITREQMEEILSSLKREAGGTRE